MSVPAPVPVPAAAQSSAAAQRPGAAEPAPPRPAREGPAAVMLVVGFVLLSLNTRVAFGQLGPLAPVAGFGTGTLTLLGLLPPLCMGLFAPLAATARRRLGEERGLFWASALLLAGAVVRILGLPGLFIGTVLVSIATAVVNVLIPVFVRSRFEPRRVGVMMGVYALSMGVGSALVAALMVPVWEASGHSWRTAIGLAAVPAALAALGIAPQLRHAGRGAGRGAEPGAVGTGVPGGAGAVGTGVPRSAGTRAGDTRARAGGAGVGKGGDRSGRTGRLDGLAWSLIAFFGLQTLLFYTTLAWLPAILVDAGVAKGTAGGMQSLFILGVAIGGFLTPVLAAARTDQRPHLFGVLLVCALGYAGLLAAPASAPALWAVVLGAGLGGGQAVAGVLYVKRGRDHDHVAALSTVAQTGGYLIAAAGPVTASVLHAVTGTWTAPLFAFVGVLLLSTVASLRAGHDRPAAGPAPVAGA
ncbi:MULTISPECIES: MFS transporter [unclassified Streptomyces]|uniref:MFS transporter n=1 Tax=unclassified Streptomyces TaxID=2593676 RepID=UPI002E76B3BB|nr:MFS transporter [Streptomyces sp. JV190]MEE1842804.1 MFS transporter [Streptomyces sp. JV190]